MGKWIQKNLWAIFIVGCSVAINTLAACRHEIAMDEAQAWLIVRDLPLLKIFAQLPYEGHPFLWYALIFPFVRLGLPVETLFVLNILLMAIAGWLLMARGPFSQPVKTLCLLSGLFIYCIPVIPRSYGLIPPLLLWLAILYPDRQQKPVLYAIALFLLSQTHVLMCGMVGMLMLLWTLERMPLLKAKQAKPFISFVSIGIMLAGVALLALLLPGMGSNITVRDAQSVSLVKIAKQAYFILGDMMENIARFRLYERGNNVYYIVLLPLFGVIAVFCWRWLRTAPRPALCFLVSFVWQMALYTFIYFYSTQRILMMLWQFIACAWITLEEMHSSSPDEAPKAPLKVPAAISMAQVLNAAVLTVALLTYSRAYTDMRYDIGTGLFSSSKPLARYVQKTLPDDAVLIAHTEGEASSVAAYLGKGRVYNVVRQSFNNYSIWDAVGGTLYKLVDLDGAVAHIREQGIQGPLYLLIAQKDQRSIQKLLQRSTTVAAGEAVEFLGSASENYILYPLTELY